MFRYSDISSVNSEVGDFVKRRRNGRLWPLCVAYLGLLLMVLVYVMWRGHVNKDPILVGIITVLPGLIILHSIYTIQRNLDLILAVEFQNALFTSAMNVRTQFSLILRRDGSVLYADRGFREIFSEVRNIDDRVVDYIMNNMRMDQRSRDKFYASLAAYTDEQIVVELHSKDNLYEKYMVSLCPLTRPQGFFLLQGRPYIEVRNAGQSAAVASPPSAYVDRQETLALMQAFGESAYLAAEDGALLTANEPFTEDLGYDTDGLLRSSLSLRDVIYNGFERKWPEGPLADFEGHAQLKRRDGTMLPIHLRQKVIRKSNGKNTLIGIVRREKEGS